MHNWSYWSVLVVSVTLLVGCEAGILRVSGGNSGERDTGVVDTGSNPDTGGLDANRPDTNRPDTGGFDANQPDTNQPDTNQPDTNQPDTNPPTPTNCESSEEAEVRSLANQARAQDGDGPLSCDTLMGEVARMHAQDMCDRGYFDHTSQDGRSPFQRMSDHGVSYSTAGENIAWGQQTPSQVHTGWMNSPGHRRNILNGAFGRIGVGYASCGGRPYWVQVFAD